MFGHASIFIIPEGRPWNEGYVFSFLAETTRSGGPLQYYAKGLTGEFPFRLEVVPARQFFYEKVFKEQRSVTRLLLPTSQNQKQNLWSNLLDLERNPEKMGDYFFIRNNCATAALAALKGAGIQINLKEIIVKSAIRGVRPKELSEMLRSALLTPYPQQYIPSLRELVSNIKSASGKAFENGIGSDWNTESSRFLPWPSSAEQELPKLKTEELLLVSQALAPTDRVRASEIEKILVTRPRRPTNLIHFIEVSPALYTTCEDSPCAQNIVRELQRTHSRDELKKLLRSNLQQALLTLTSFKPEIDYSKSNQVRHWKLLNEELEKQLER